MADDIGTQLKKVAGNQTLQLVHQGRKSGKSYEVTIWFMVEGETVYLATSNSSRQWVRNILARPAVTLRIGGQSFTGKAEPISDEAGRAHVMELVGQKYWYARPYMWVFQMLAGAGLATDRRGAFRVRLDSSSS
ncbi:MAG: nitroreductase family deazaflavin-dependent oxidoreductase [Candidatus Binatales bacterium]